MDRLFSRRNLVIFAELVAIAAFIIAIGILTGR